MSADPFTLIIDPESELGRALEISHDPVVLTSGNERFTVSRELRDDNLDHKIEAFGRALRAIAGTITPEEAERWKEQIYRAREEGSRPITRP